MVIGEVQIIHSVFYYSLQHDPNDSFQNLMHFPQLFIHVPIRKWQGTVRALFQ